MHLKILRFAYTTDLNISLVLAFLGVYILVQYYCLQIYFKKPSQLLFSCFCVRLESLRIQLGYTLTGGKGGGGGYSAFQVTGMIK